MGPQNQFFERFYQGVLVFFFFLISVDVKETNIFDSFEVPSRRKPPKWTLQSPFFERLELGRYIFFEMCGYLRRSFKGVAPPQVSI